MHFQIEHLPDTLEIEILPCNSEGTTGFLYFLTSCTDMALSSQKADIPAPSGKTSSWRFQHFVMTLALFGVGFIEMGVMKSFGVLIGDLVTQLHSDIGTIGLVIGTYHGIAFFLCELLVQ